MYPEEKFDFGTDKREANIYKGIVQTTDQNSRSRLEHENVLFAIV